jgi:hypothetical protein
MALDEKYDPDYATARVQHIDDRIADHKAAVKALEEQKKRYTASVPKKS